MPVPAAARSYGSVAETYDRVRPGYPVEALQHVIADLAIVRGSRVLDIGAGTGKLTGELVNVGLSPLAVEPLMGMAAMFQRNHDRLPIVLGLAERLPIQDGSVAAIFCAQSWHWFDKAEAGKELARVLAPSGGVVLIWNMLNRSREWVRAADLLHDQHAQEGTPGRTIDMDLGVTEFEQLEGFEPANSVTFDNELSSSLPEYLERMLASSGISGLGEQKKAAFALNLASLVRDYKAVAKDGSMRLPYQTLLCWRRATKDAGSDDR